MRAVSRPFVNGLAIALLGPFALLFRSIRGNLAAPFRRRPKHDR